MNIELIKNLANKKGLSITKLEVACGFGNGTIGKWTKQSPSCDNLYKVANYLGVSIDYLYTGKEKSLSPELSEDKQRLLDMYNLLTDIEKGEILGELKVITRNASKIRTAKPHKIDCLQ